jgi:hypothetical protein
MVRRLYTIQFRPCPSAPRAAACGLQARMGWWSPTRAPTGAARRWSSRRLPSASSPFSATRLWWRRAATDKTNSVSVARRLPADMEVQKPIERRPASPRSFDFAVAKRTSTCSGIIRAILRTLRPAGPQLRKYRNLGSGDRSFRFEGGRQLAVHYQGTLRTSGYQMLAVVLTASFAR